MPAARRVKCTECVKTGRTCNKTINQKGGSSACDNCKTAHKKCNIAASSVYATEDHQLPALSSEDLTKAQATVQAIRTLLIDWVKSSSGTAASYFPLEAQLRCMPILEGCLRGISLVEDASWMLSDGMRRLEELDNFCAMTLPARPGQIISFASPGYPPSGGSSEAADNLDLLVRATGNTLQEHTNPDTSASTSAGASLPAEPVRARNKGKGRANPPATRIDSFGPQCRPTAPGSPTLDRASPPTREEVMRFISVSARNVDRETDSESSDDENPDDVQSPEGKRFIVQSKRVLEQEKKRKRQAEYERAKRRQKRQQSASL